MDIVLLKTLLAVAETGSFSGAANSLHCVQSNVTSRIRRLEDHFGQKIFLRGKAGATLTGFGERLHAKAEDLLQLFEAAERELLDAAGAGAPLALGSMETTAAVRLPGLLKVLKDRVPAAPVSLRTGPTADLLAMVRARKIDAAFVAGPVDTTRFNAVRAFTERLVWARNPAASENGSLLAFRSGCSYRATAEAWLKSLGRSDTQITEMGTLDGILGCVAAGLGFAVVPEEAVRGARDADRLEVSPLPEPFATVDTFLVRRLDHEPVEAHRTLIEVLTGQA